MANSVTLEVILEGKNIRLVQKQIDDVTQSVNEAAAAQDKVSKSTEKATGARNRYNRTEKGTAQNTSNTSKAFAKQAQGISGGLVPAYAVLAANIFAIGEAFRALRETARIEQLAEGMTSLGKASGLAMGTLSKGLREATEGALSLEESMRSVALITSAGLNPAEIERFGKVAKNASIALGRDTADSLARLTRGVTKLEPELLDELGIMVRLDEAAENYASELGKTASQLTNFEKRQAFMNAVLSEGEAKFGALGDSVKVNPYDRLAASFSNLAKTLIGLISGPLSVLAEFLASSPSALLSVITLFGGTVVKKMVPALEDLQASSKAYAESTKEMAKANAANISQFKGGSRKVRDYIKDLQDGELSLDGVKEAMKGNAGSIRRFSGLLEKAGVDTKNTGGFLQRMKNIFAETTPEVAALNQKYKEQIAISNELIRTKLDLELQAQREQESTIVNTILNGNFTKGLKDAKADLKERVKLTKDAIINTKGLAKANVLAAGSYAVLGAAATYAAAAISRIAPWVTAAIALFAILGPVVEMVMNLFRSDAQQRYIEKAKEMGETNKELAGNFAEIDKELKGQRSSIVNVNQRYIALNNALNTFKGKYEELDKSSPIGEFEAQAEALDALVSSSELLTSKFDENSSVGRTVSETMEINNETKGQAIQRTKEYIDSLAKETATHAGLAQTVKDSGKIYADYLNSLKKGTNVDELVTNFEDMSKQIQNATNRAAAGQQVLQGLSSKQVKMFNVEREKKLVDGLIDAIQMKREQLQKKLDQINKTSGFPALELEKQIAADNAEIAELQSLMDGLSAKAADRVLKEGEFFKTLQEEKIVFESQLGILETNSKLISMRDGESLEKRKALREVENQIIDRKKQNINIQIQEQAAAFNQAETEAERQSILARINELGNDYALLVGTQTLNAEKEQLKNAEDYEVVLKQKVQYEKEALAVMQKAAELQSRALETEMKIQRLNAQAQSAREGKGFVVTAQQEAKIQRDTLQARLDASFNEQDLKEKSIKMEYSLLKARMQVALFEAENINKQIEDPSLKIDTGMISEAIGMIDSAQTAAIQANSQEFLARRLQAINSANEVEKKGQDEMATESARAAAQKAELQDSITQQALALESKINANNAQRIESRKKLLEAEATLRNLKDPKIQEAKLTAKDVADIEAALIEEKKQIAVEEFFLKQKTIEAEYKLLQAKTELSKQEALIKARELNLQLQAQGKPGLDISSIETAYNTISNLQTEARDSAMGTLSEGLRAEIAALDTTLATVGQTANQEATGTKPVITGMQAAQSTSGATVDDPTASTGDRVSAGVNIFAGMAEDLAKLGPQGELISAVAQGAMVISDAWQNVGTVFSQTGEEAASGAEKFAAVAGAAAATFGAIGAMQKAQSEQQVRAIDAEIEAERNKDGKSKESLAKIQKLEQKKDAIKRKAFEQDKKMKLAQAVMSTAQAVATAIAGPPGLPWSAVFAAMAAAMGAAQIRAIQSTSYQGGGSVPSGGGMASEISVGQRKQSVDLAKTQGGAGELAYLRGEQGIGSAENFKPAFMGAKYRAAGGPTTGYVVGEQGPELFVPEGPGRIVPNNEMQQSAPINANINISAIDAAGVEEVLVRQRGHIIGMMREAANSYGQNFMEEVDTAVYTPSAGGARKY